MTDGAEYDRGDAILGELAELRERHERLTHELDELHADRLAGVHVGKLRLAMARATGREGEGHYEHRH